MIKTAILVEGQTEQIIIRNALFNIFDASTVSFDCFHLHRKKEGRVRFAHCPPEPEYYFLILDIGNDEKVMSYARSREKGLFKAGFSKIILVRDLYGDRYRKQARGQINAGVTQRLLAGAQTTINSMSQPNNVSHHFAFMEAEAWILGMHELITNVYPTLTPQYVYQQTGIELSQTDPETAFFHPTSVLRNIVQLAGGNYSKKRGEVEALTSGLDRHAVFTAFQNGRCQNLRLLFREFLSICLSQ